MFKTAYVILAIALLSGCTNLNKGKINLNFSANPVEYSIK